MGLLQEIGNILQGCLAGCILLPFLFIFMMAGIGILHGLLSKIPIVGPYLYKPYIAPFIGKAAKALWAKTAPYRQNAWRKTRDGIRSGFEAIERRLPF